MRADKTATDKSAPSKSLIDFRQQRADKCATTKSRHQQTIDSPVNVLGL
jgi:hypothetical protein